MHKYDKHGRFIESFYSHSDVDVKLEDLQPPKWCVFAEQHPLPEHDDLVVATAPSGYTLIKYHQEYSEYATSTAMAAYKILETAAEDNAGTFGIGCGSDRWVACTCAVRPIEEAQTGL